MDLADALAFCRSRHQGVLVTIRAKGRPQLSNIVYVLGDDGIARISVTDSRAKTKNLARDPRGSLYVVGDSHWSYVVLDGTAELMPVTTDPADATAEVLVELYRSVQGEHPDWDEYRQAMIDDHRLVVCLRVERAYGMTGG